jgi:hypothetical protein
VQYSLAESLQALSIHIFFISRRIKNLKIPIKLSYGKILLIKYSDDEAYWISRALTGCSYDFSKRLYWDVRIERYIRDALQERKDLFKYQIVAPQALCDHGVVTPRHNFCLRLAKPYSAS